MNQIKVSFYSPTYEQEKSNRLDEDTVKVSATPYYLHGYFRTNYPEHSEKIKWGPILLETMTTEEIAEQLNLHDIDVFCASLYMWNIHKIMDTIKDLKSKVNKPIKIVVGGPSCDADKYDWNVKYPFVDHFVIGQGEKVWSELCLDWLNVKTITEDATNVVHFLKKGETVVKKFESEFIRGIHYSPMLTCKDMISDIINSYKGKELTWVYETQRGCPYHCAFCDWNGGRSNKTQKRKHVDFIEEIDFMAENKMYNMYIGDANFGMWDVDVDIMKRLAYHNQNGHKFNFVSYNMSKKINDNYKQIVRLLIENGFNKHWVKLSVQDIHDVVLNNIDRPGTWQENKELGLELYRDYSEKYDLKKIFVELILGLPGQTVQSFIETLNEFYSNGFVPRTYVFCLLENAPATYNTEWREKHKIIDKQCFEILDTIPSGNSIQKMIENKTNNIIYRQVIGSYSYTTKELVEMTMIDQLYRVLFSKRNWKNWGWIDNIWEHLQPITEIIHNTQDFKEILEQRYHNLETYGINLAEDVNGNVMTRNMDLGAIVYRNLDLIIESLERTGIKKEDKEELLAYWRTFERWANLPVLSKSLRLADNKSTEDFDSHDMLSAQVIV